MYHSVTIGTKNTYDDWHLVPDGRPVISMPEFQSNYVEVPGMSGVLDLSESLTGYPLYKNRQGSLKFHVLNGYQDWASLHHEIANYLHGKKLKMTLEDDPHYYYEGRFTFNQWLSNSNGTWSDVEIGYNLDPYKYYYKTSIQEAPSICSNVVLEQGGRVDLGDIVGDMPVIPEISILDFDDGLRMTFYNNDLNIFKSTTITSTGTKKYNYIIFSKQASGYANYINLEFDRKVKYSILFRRGSL